MDISELKVSNVSAHGGVNGVDIVVSYYDDSNNKQFLREQFKPYLYVPLEAEIPEVIKGDIDSIEESKIDSMDGKKVKKIILKRMQKQNFEFVRNSFELTYEDDIHYNVRYIIDKGVKFTTNQKILYLDVETNMSTDSFHAAKEIISMVVYDSFNKECYVFAWHREIKASKYAKDGRKYMIFTSERDMLTKFFLLMKCLKADVITGWYCDVFDIPYIIQRAINLRIDYRDMSPLRDVWLMNNEDKEKVRMNIGGTDIVDLMAIYKKMAIYEKPANFRLETVADFVFGGEFSKMKRPNFAEVWTPARINELLDYNIRDVDVCVRLDTTLRLLDYFLRIQQLSPMPLSHIFHVSKVVDDVMLHEYHNKCIFPSKRNREKVPIEGGYVLNPPSELLKNVVCLDFAAMYTSIYISFNLSPELIIELPNSSNDVVVDDVVFSQHKQGLIPELLKKLLKRRKEMVKERDKYEPGTIEYRVLDDTQGLFKEILNTFYGALGYSGFRLFNPFLARTITKVAREMLLWAIEKSKAKGYRVVYADTDSCFVVMPEDATDLRCLQMGLELEKEINESLKDFMRQYTKNEELIKNNILELQFENFYSSIMFTGVKKRYAGILKIKKESFANAPKTMGFDVVRRDTPAAVRSLLEDIFKKILNGESSKIQGVINEFKTKLPQFSPYELGLSRPINKEFSEYTTTVQHIHAAQYSNKHLGTSWKKGDSGKLIYVSVKDTSKYPKTEAILIDEDTVIPPEIIIDYDKLLEVHLYQKLEVFNATKGINLGISFRPINQTGLEAFM